MRAHINTDSAALKCFYLAIMSLDPTGTGQRRWSIRWKRAPLHAERHRIGYNTVRSHEALFGNGPHDVHLGPADPRVPNSPEPGILPTA